MAIAQLIPRKWILMSLLISVQCLAQVEVVSYDYWFNNDYSNKVTTNITTPSETFELNQIIATNGLSYGINTFNIRFKDNANLWSGVVSEFFTKHHKALRQIEKLLAMNIGLIIMQVHEFHKR